MSLSTLKLSNYKGNLKNPKINNIDVIIPENYCIFDFGNHGYYSEKDKTHYYIGQYAYCLDTKRLITVCYINGIFLIDTLERNMENKIDKEISRRAEIIKLCLKSLPQNIAYFRQYLAQEFAGSDVHKDIFSYIKHFLL
jgi:hypothetical protein